MKTCRQCERRLDKRNQHGWCRHCRARVFLTPQQRKRGTAIRLQNKLVKQLADSLDGRGYRRTPDA